MVDHRLEDRGIVNDLSFQEEVREAARKIENLTEPIRQPRLVVRFCKMVSEDIVCYEGKHLLECLHRRIGCCARAQCVQDNASYSLALSVR